MNTWQLFILKTELIKALPFNVRKSLNKIRNRRAIPLNVVPKAVDLELLNELCYSVLGEYINNVSYIHTSAWKPNGTYRLLIHAKNGLNWSIIYKNAEYKYDQIPALKDFPYLPGYGEYLIYKDSKDALSEYIPVVYSCKEIKPGEHYQYFLEDLNLKYKMISKGVPNNILIIIERLPDIHNSIEKWASGKRSRARKLLPRYNQYFSLAIQKYAKNNLVDYYFKTRDRMVAEILKIWPKICYAYMSVNIHELYNLIPIHGDFNTSNIWVQKDDQKNIKIVDWEWTGFGLPHADLASLMVYFNHKFEMKGIKIYSIKNNELSYYQHWVIYQWCKLERALIDGSFMAAQYMNGPQSHKIIMPKFISNAMYRILKAYNELQKLCF